MEYQSISLAIVGIITGVFWSLDYWKVLKKPELILPIGDFKPQSKIIRLAVYAIGLLAWLLISYALTGPRKPLKFMPNNIEVNDIFLVVDVSRSMLANDLKPNRLEVAKLKLREFAALRPTDRIGIIIFSEKIFTLLPLTTDPGLVDQVLGDIRIGFLGSGTNIGDALALAVARAQASETKNKVIVLLTDGVNNIGNMTPTQAAEVAKDFGIKVYTIGLGTTKGAKIPLGNSVFGQQYQNIPGGSIDLKTLNEISKMTGGKAYMANSDGNLAEILSEIQKLEKTKIKSQSQVVYDELYFPYLLWGILMLFFTEIGRRFVIREVV